MTHPDYAVKYAVFARYQDVDDSGVCQILQENLGDIKGFIQAVISKFF